MYLKDEATLKVQSSRFVACFYSAFRRLFIRNRTLCLLVMKHKLPAGNSMITDLSSMGIFLLASCVSISPLSLMAGGREVARHRSCAAPCGPLGGCRSRHSWEHQTAPLSSHQGNLQSSYGNDSGRKLTQESLCQVLLQQTRNVLSMQSVIFIFFGVVFSIHSYTDLLRMTRTLHNDIINKQFPSTMR